jgi:hypothetical protein
MSILDDINNEGNKETYQELKPGELKKIIEDTFLNIPPAIEVTLYTGIIGMYIMDLCMMGYGEPYFVHYTFEHYKRTRNIIVLNLFQKSGLIKAIINTRNRTFEVREGTKVIKEATKFEEIKDYLTRLETKQSREFYTPKGIKKYIK